MKYLLLATMLAASGCATYAYTKTDNGCTVEIVSTRTVAGAGLSIGPNCEIQSNAESLDNKATLEAIGKLLPQ
jgi:hypothetical protein